MKEDNCRPVSIDLDEEAEYLAKETGCAFEEADRYVDAVSLYNIYVGVEDEHELKYFAVDPAENRGEYNVSFMVESDELMSFVCKKSGMDRVLAEKLEEAEMKFYELNGIIG